MNLHVVVAMKIRIACIALASTLASTVFAQSPASGELTCTMPQGVWHFSVRNDSLNGELRLVDNTRFRAVRTKRAP